MVLFVCSNSYMFENRLLRIDWIHSKFLFVLELPLIKMNSAKTINLVKYRWSMTRSWTKISTLTDRVCRQRPELQRDEESRQTFRWAWRRRRTTWSPPSSRTRAGTQTRPRSCRFAFLYRRLLARPWSWQGSRWLRPQLWAARLTDPRRGTLWNRLSNE